MVVEQAHLGDSRRAYESRVVIELRTCLHAAAARDATRQRIGNFLRLLRDARAGTKIIAAIDWYPGFDLFKILKKHTAIDGEIAHHRKFRERLQLDRLIKMIEQGGASHAGASVDQHGARTAD